MPLQAVQGIFPIPLHSGQGETVIFLFRDVRLVMRPEVFCSSTIQPGFEPRREFLHFEQSAKPVWLQRRQGSTPLHQHVVQGSLSARSSGGLTLVAHSSCRPVPLQRGQRLCLTSQRWVVNGLPGVTSISPSCWPR